MKEYIKKAIETESGFNAECWVITGIWVDLKANCAVISLDGYKDFESKESGRQVMGTASVTIDDVSELSSYDDIRQDVIAAVFGSGKFTGATLEEVTE